MEKEFEELTKKLRNLHILMSSNNFSEDSRAMLDEFKRDQKIHHERLSQMLDALPPNVYVFPQDSEQRNPVADDQVSALNQDALNSFSRIDISDFSKSIQQLLMEKIDHLISTIVSQHASLNLNNLSHNTSNVMENINFFNNVTLKMDIIRELYSFGVNQTSAQKCLIDSCKQGKNSIVFTQNGIYKSMLFIIPLLHNLRTELNECQVLVLVPTEELAVYINEALMCLYFIIGIDVHKSDKTHVSIVPLVEVGRPPELYHKLNEGTIKRRYIDTVIIIGPEKMLLYVDLINHGVLKKLVRDTHITLISSNQFEIVLRFFYKNLENSRLWFSDPTEIQNVFIDLPKQFYFSIEEELKVYLLSEINSWFGDGRFIVFCNSIDKAQRLCSLLYDLSPSIFHLDMDINQRNQILKLFFSKYIRILFTLDSINVNEFQLADCIVYYDIPANPICYLNRITQCATNIKVVNFISVNDDYTKRVIETLCKSSMIPWPTIATKFV